MTQSSEYDQDSARQNLGHKSLIVVLGMATWLNPDTFLWRDDWTFLAYYFKHDFSLFKGDLASDIKPLFQYAADLEFFLFRDHFLLYQAVNVSLLIGGALCAYHILKLLQIDKTISLLVSIFLLLHPVN